MGKCLIEVEDKQLLEPVLPNLFQRECYLLAKYFLLINGLHSLQEMQGLQDMNSEFTYHWWL